MQHQHQLPGILLLCLGISPTCYAYPSRISKAALGLAMTNMGSCLAQVTQHTRGSWWQQPHVQPVGKQPRYHT